MTPCMRYRVEKAQGMKREMNKKMKNSLRQKIWNKFDNMFPLLKIINRVWCF